MDCICEFNEDRTHKVIRDYGVVGEYLLCIRCNKINWLWKLDKLEEEITQTPNHFFISGYFNGSHRAEV